MLFGENTTIKMNKNEEITQKDKIVTMVVATLGVIVVLSGIILVNYFLNKNKSVEIPAATISPSEYPDYDAIKGIKPDEKIKTLNITEGCLPEVCTNTKPATISFEGINKKYKVSGKFSRAYLYAELLVDNKRPLTSCDDFYFKINGIGGHIIPDKNILPVPPSGTSRYLYDLRSISFFPSMKERWNKQNNINFFYLLQDGITLDISATISSDRPGRVMKEVAIYYECSEGSECSIQELK